MIEFRGICKSFPGVQALEDVSLGVAKGSCHALMGENGAGKSTLGKILAGIYQADSGKILLSGKEMLFKTPRDAKLAGSGDTDLRRANKQSFRSRVAKTDGTDQGT